MKLFFRCLILIVGISGQGEASPCEEILEYIENRLPQEGVLKSSEDFVYVALDNAYIHELISFIQKEGFEEPPYFSGAYDVGAHISVIYPRELAGREPLKIGELGKEIVFQVKSCEVCEAPRLGGEVWVVLVDAPELDRLRIKYGLPAGAHFHITIGLRMRSSP